MWTHSRTSLRYVGECLCDARDHVHVDINTCVCARILLVELRILFEKGVFEIIIVIITCVCVYVFLPSSLPTLTRTRTD